MLSKRRKKERSETERTLKNEKLSKKKLLKKGNSFNKRILENALAHIQDQTKNRRNGLSFPKGCRAEDFGEASTDDQVKLRCRQLPNVVTELRKSILRQDWNETATLLMILCHPGLKLYSPIIIKTCFILLFCHPNSNFELLQNFIRNATGYFLDEDINKFIKILLILNRSASRKWKSVRFLKCHYQKLVKDPDFAGIE